MFGRCDLFPLYGVLALHGCAEHTRDDGVEGYLSGDRDKFIAEEHHDLRWLGGYAALRDLFTEWRGRVLRSETPPPICEVGRFTHHGRAGGAVRGRERVWEGGSRCDTVGGDLTPGFTP